MSTFLKSSPAYKTCVSISESAPRKALSALKRALGSSDYAELRLDSVAPSDVPALLELVTPYIHRCVCTLRPKSEGGQFSGDEAERISILKLIAEYSPMLVDVEYSTMHSSPALRRYLVRAGAHVLVSWHNFERTPTIGVLRRKLDAMSRYSDTLKIVTMAKNAHDSSRVLGLYAGLSKIRLVAFCMGDEGRASRVLSLYLGGPFTYVSMNKPIAPGQLSLAEMRRLLPSRRTISFK